MDPYDWTEAAHLTVAGIPQPQGSKSCVCIKGKGRLLEGRRGPARKAFAKWRGDITAAAIFWQSTHNAEPLDAPCRLRVTFRMPCPISSRWSVPAVRPDLDKLVRAVCDSLTKVLYADDSRVVELVARKVYAAPGAHGVAITLERL